MQLLDGYQPGLVFYTLPYTQVERRYPEDIGLYLHSLGRPEGLARAAIRTQKRVIIIGNFTRTQWERCQENPPGSSGTFPKFSFSLHHSDGPRLRLHNFSSTSDRSSPHLWYDPSLQLQFKLYSIAFGRESFVQRNSEWMDDCCGALKLGVAKPTRFQVRERVQMAAFCREPLSHRI